MLGNGFDFRSATFYFPPYHLKRMVNMMRHQGLEAALSGGMSPFLLRLRVRENQGLHGATVSDTETRAFTLPGRKQPAWILARRTLKRF